MAATACPAAPFAGGARARVGGDAGRRGTPGRERGSQARARSFILKRAVPCSSKADTAGGKRVVFAIASNKFRRQRPLYSRVLCAPLGADSGAGARPFRATEPIVYSGELQREPPSSHSRWSAANSVIDPNAALWASLRPPPPPSWPVLVRQRVSELSLAAVGQRLHASWPRWLASSQTAQLWLLCAAAGIAMGLGIGFAMRAMDRSIELDSAGAASSVPSAGSRAPGDAESAAPARAGVASERSGLSATAPRPAAPAPGAAKLADVEARSVEPSPARLAEPTSASPRKRISAVKKRRSKATSQRRAAKRKRKKR